MLLTKETATFPESHSVDVDVVTVSPAVIDAVVAPVPALNPQELREKMRSQRKLFYQGLAGGIGPARTEKTSKGGRARDILVAELVFEFNESTVATPDKTRIVVYCIACDHRSVGRDTACIREHASNCKVSFVF